MRYFSPEHEHHWVPATMFAQQERKAYQEKLDEDKRKRQAACKHEKTKKEYDRGMDTGDKICMDCGKLI